MFALLFSRTGLIVVAILALLAVGAAGWLTISGLRKDIEIAKLEREALAEQVKERDRAIKQITDDQARFARKLEGIAAGFRALQRQMSQNIVDRQADHKAITRGDTPDELEASANGMNGLFADLEALSRPK